MTLWLQKFSETKMSELFGFPTGGFPPTTSSTVPPSIEPATQNTTTPFVLTPQMQMQLQMQLLLRQTIAQMITYSQLAPSMVQPTSSTSSGTVRNDNDTNSVTRILVEKTTKKKKTPKEICCNGCAAPNCNECQHCRNRKWKKKCLKRQCLKKTSTSDKTNNFTRRTKRLLPHNN